MCITETVYTNAVVAELAIRQEMGWVVRQIA